MHTERLILRPWRDDDLAPFAALNADPEVMRHFPAPLDRAQSDALAARWQQGIDERGWGLWAVALRDGGEFVGMVGLNPPVVVFPFSPCVEVGWRLAQRHWGRGYASEAARAALAFGFDTLGLDEIVSFTAVPNLRSQAVMRRLGMTRGDDFDHPALAADHPLRRHVLYRLAAQAWRG
ncbi:GNAT family N-acetyltransferase [Chitiniphilus shinanonensis]|uniref:GNAT family N-acetyltransferase n=1 Tax=Chitiniphilus shinanonensis TaxID=553088 RepID=UPI0030537840